MRAQLAIEIRSHPIAPLEHLDRAAGVARLVAVPQFGSAEIRKENDRADRNQHSHLYANSLHHGLLATK